jgi:hypothetical protein
MGTAAELTDDGGERVSHMEKHQIEPRFDLDRFREEQAELYKSYLRDAVPQRRFLLKAKGAAVCPQPLPSVPTAPKLELAQAE